MNKHIFCLHMTRQGRWRLLLSFGCFLVACTRLGLLLLNRHNTSTVNDDHHHNNQSPNPSPHNNRNNTRNNNNNSSSNNYRILYIVTSMHEFDTGKRRTKTGYDRFSNTLVPVMRESIASMLQAGYTVNAVLITHYPLSNARRQELRTRISPFCTVTVWPEATPIGYATEHSTTHIQPVTRALARQHRYVIKDQYFQHDFFVNFEDDMLITASHVAHFTKLSNQLYTLRIQAPDELIHDSIPQARERFHGPMTTLQLERLIPGFIRVEAVATAPQKQQSLAAKAAVPTNFHWKPNQIRHVSATDCCQFASSSSSSSSVPQQQPVTAQQLYFWETSLDVLGVRKLPDNDDAKNQLDDDYFDWLVFLGGNEETHYPRPEFVLGDYWSGRDHDYFDTTRPDRTKSRYMNSQGGWMATRRQIKEWNGCWCRGGFLPPYDRRAHPGDGLEKGTVEYWSGGIQIAGVKSCNLQRVVTMDPDGFGRQLLYHTSNNKQKQVNIRFRFSTDNIDEFWGQLNTVRLNAEENMKGDALAF